MKIILLGYMASGKSSIGRQVAENMNLKFIDLDSYIEERQQKSIPHLFKEKGEIYFRKMEHEALLALLSTDDHFVLALGGGTPCYANNMNFITKDKNAMSIYLRLNVNELSNRLIKEKDSRPLVASLADEKIPEFIAKHLFERRSFYEQAKFAINADHKSIEQLALEITSLVNQSK